MIGLWLCLAWVSLPSSSALQPLRDAPLLLLREEGLRPPYNERPPMAKRVFLSRGWGPGGYEAPAQGAGNAGDLVRLANLLFKEGITMPEPRVASVIASKPFKFRPSNDLRWQPTGKSFREKDLSEPLEYRRFHSIFTSGTWSPLGKRGGPRLPRRDPPHAPYEPAQDSPDSPAFLVRRPEQPFARFSPLGEDYDDRD